MPVAPCMVAQQRADVATTGIATGDVAGLCRALIRGAAEPIKTPAASPAARAARPPGRRARVRPRQPAAEHAGRHATNDDSPAPAWPSIAASLPSLPFFGRLPPSSSSCKVMTHILFSFEWCIVYYEWELSLGGKKYV